MSDEYEIERLFPDGAWVAQRRRFSGVSRSTRYQSYQAAVDALAAFREALPTDSFRLVAIHTDGTREVIEP